MLCINGLGTWARLGMPNALVSWVLVGRTSTGARDHWGDGCREGGSASFIVTQQPSVALFSTEVALTPASGRGR
jgi:hypothetical protein